LNRWVLKDEQWERVAPLLPGKAGDPGRTGSDNRRAFAVTYGYSHKPHAELGADRLIDTMSELLPIIENAAAA
jgi:transposase